MTQTDALDFNHFGNKLGAVPSWAGHTKPVSDWRTGLMLPFVCRNKRVLN